MPIGMLSLRRSRPGLPTLNLDVRRQREERQVERQCARYRYRAPEDNALYPVAAAASFDVRRELFGPRWALPFLPGFGRAIAKRVRARVEHGLRRQPRATEAIAAHRAFFGGAENEPLYVSRLFDDGQFGFNRVGGVNPTIVAAVESREHLRDRMPGLDDLAFARAMGGRRTIEQELEEGNLLLCDYEILARAIGSPDGRCSRWRDKYLPAPVVLLCERPGVLRFSDLVPVAITIDQPNASGPNPLYLRESSTAWQIAKYFVEVADHCHHMAVGHLSCAHFIMEAVALTTRRQLLPSHPLRILLETHTRHTLPVNEIAYRNFVDPSQIYARFYGGDLEETAAIARLARTDRDFLDLDLERDLERRGVADAISDYPYRDDARLYLGPTREFCEAWVDEHYRTDAELRLDRRLRAWADELTEPTYGNLGRLDRDAVDSKRALVRVLSRILFIAGPGHAAHHFAEMHYCRFAPMYPGASFRPPPASDEEANERYFAEMLPPLDLAGEHFMYSDFGAHQYDTFGTYRDPRLMSSPRIRKAALRFQRRMSEAETEIRRRNTSRLLPYEILLPSAVPNVINF